MFSSACLFLYFQIFYPLSPIPTKLVTSYATSSGQIILHIINRIFFKIKDLIKFHAQKDVNNVLSWQNCKRICWILEINFTFKVISISNRWQHLNSSTFYHKHKIQTICNQLSLICIFWLLVLLSSIKIIESKIASKQNIKWFTVAR